MNLLAIVFLENAIAEANISDKFMGWPNQVIKELPTKTDGQDREVLYSDLIGEYELPHTPGGMLGCLSIPFPFSFVFIFCFFSLLCF
jgi:hypothetical protein